MNPMDWQTLCEERRRRGMARIRYLSVLSENPEELAQFYKRYLQMVEIGRSPEGDISLTDGFYNFTLFKGRPALREPRMEPGLHHIGVEVDSLEEAKARYLEFNPRGIIMPESGDIHHGELRIYDPECNPVSLSERGFGVRPERKLPRIGHVAYNALDPERILSFYTQVLGLREVKSSYSRRQQGRSAGPGKKRRKEDRHQADGRRPVPVCL